MAELSAPPPPDEQTLVERFPAMRIRQPIGDIYVAKMSAKQITKITFFDVRRRIQAERDIERYLGIQRPLNEKRVEALNAYVNFTDAAFPTAIIIAVEGDYATFDDAKSELILSNTRRDAAQPDTNMVGLCRVIDGQHRIAGLDEFKGAAFEVMVAVFVGSDIADQAYIFATVNLEQNKVNKSLAYDLFELARSRSPYKTCHNITVALDREKDSPFYQSIKRLGVATEGRTRETLTQATFVNSLVRYISDDPKGDRDLILRGKRLEKASPNELQRLVFRNMFIDNEDVKIGKIIEHYFEAVALTWPKAWVTDEPGIMLNRTNGFRALMRLFGPIYNSLKLPGAALSPDHYLPLFKSVNVPWDFFNTDRFKPGTSGEADLRRFLHDSIFPDKPTT